MDDLAQQVMAITNVNLEEAANLLQCTNFIIEDAVNLYFAQTQLNSKSHDQNASGIASTFLTDEYQEVEVRKPSVVKRQRLLSYEAIYNMPIGTNIPSNPLSPY
jgi:hypothetical protein